MSRRVTAFYDSRSEAEAARTRLSQSNIEAERVRIVDQNETGSSTGSSSSSASSGDGEGFWSSLKSTFLPEEDSHTYEEGMRRGGCLLCAEVDEADADRAIAILDETGSVDLDQRQSEWRNDGWAGTSSGTSGMAQARTSDRTVEEEHIPLVEEQLRVGKREVARGGARVRSYVQETPVHEQVNLREEHVSVERRPVDQTLERGALDRDSDLLRERTVEMTERAEEAVVEKEARVREELVLKKTAEERTEQIDDTVRRTEVEVEDGQTRSGDRSAFGSFGGSATQGSGAGSQGSSGLASGAGAESRDRESEGTGYDPRIDKSGL